MRLGISQHVPLLFDHFIVFPCEVDHFRLAVMCVELNTGGPVRYDRRSQHALCELRVIVIVCIEWPPLDFNLGILLASFLVNPGHLALVQGGSQGIPTTTTEASPTFTGSAHQCRLQRDVVFD